MGCATAWNPELQEVGLFGSHAYSILDVREVPTSVENDDSDMEVRCYDGPRGTVQLIRIRNPHGMGEWNREWSDASVLWTDRLACELGRTGVDDGTFWMDYVHFLMAFEVVDVCYSHCNWHAKSFTNYFCDRADRIRLCRYAYEIQVSESTTLHATALQTTKRGTWCHGNRKRYYQLGDLSLVLVRVKDDSPKGVGMVYDGVVAGIFNGGVSRASLHAVLENASERYLLIAICLGTGPLASECTNSQEASFKVRIYSSESLMVRPVVTGRAIGISAVAAAAMQSICLSPPHNLGIRVKCSVRRVSTTERFLVRTTYNGVVFFTLVHKSAVDTSCVQVRLQVYARGVTARTHDGITSGRALPGEILKLQICDWCGYTGHQAQNCLRVGRRRRQWQPQTWQIFEVVCNIPAGKQQLVMAMTHNNFQSQIGRAEVEIVANSKSGQNCAWQSAEVHPFAVLPLLQDAFAHGQAAEVTLREPVWNAGGAAGLFEEDDHQLAEAIALSLAEAADPNATSSVVIHAQLPSDLEADAAKSIQDTSFASVQASELQDCSRAFDVEIANGSGGYPLQGECKGGMDSEGMNSHQGATLRPIERDAAVQAAIQASLGVDKIFAKKEFNKQVKEEKELLEEFKARKKRADKAEAMKTKGQPVLTAGDLFQKQEAVALAIAKLIHDSAGKALTINHLNQDAL